ncbi:MAG: hypothetical protein KAG64_08995 [Bacteroidales bacterium]|nr:hypothetical protein [Bacteroidales bacterium]
MIRLKSILPQKLLIFILLFSIPHVIQAHNTDTIKKEDTVQVRGLDNLNLKLNFNYNFDLSGIGITNNTAYEKENSKRLDMSKIIIAIIILSLGLVLYLYKVKNGAQDKAEQQHELALVENKRAFLWREKGFSSAIGDSISTIKINQAYVDTIAEDEKAALAYVLTFVENGCEWNDGTISIDDDKLICKGLSSLGFEYQGSSEHISFLKSWFANDSLALVQIANYPRFFPGTTIYTTIKNIEIERNENKIHVYATKVSHNSRAQKEVVKEEEYLFLSEGNSLKLLKQ